jgi:MinD-like ATPase involved in chromosome partitioning or flagellar assembly
MNENLISRFLSSSKTQLTSLETGKVFSVWGPHGSTGKTTIATNLAIELALAGKRVFLLDADCSGPSLATHFGLAEHPAGLAAACRLAGQDRFDLEQLERLSVGFVKEKLFVMTGLTSVNRWAEVMPTHLAEILKTAREHFDFVILDLASDIESLDIQAQGVSRNSLSRSALALSDQVIAVGLADPVGIFRFLSSKEQLFELVSQPPLIIINRLRATVLGSNAKSQVTETLNRLGDMEVSLYLPEDSVNLDQAMQVGLPLSLSQKQGPFRQALVQFVKSQILSSKHSKN